MVHNRLAHKTQISIISGLILVNVGVTLRFCARWVGRLKITIDDYLMLLALVTYCGMGIGGFVIISHDGFGLPFVDTPPDGFVIFMKVLYAETFLYTATVALTKASILTMYCRVLPSQWTRINSYVCGSIVVLWAIAVSITNSIACLPVQHIWNIAVPGTCIDWASFYYGMQIPNILTDIYIVIIPLREVFSLRLTKVQKAILVGIFGIATVTIVFDIVRLVAMLEFAASEDDITIGIIEPTIWTCVEPAVGIFAACLTNLRPLFRRASNCVQHLTRNEPPESHDRVQITGFLDEVAIKRSDPSSASTDNDYRMGSSVGTTVVNETRLTNDVESGSQRDTNG